jgi:hypothetical protein
MAGCERKDDNIPGVVKQPNPAQQHAHRDQIDVLA